MQQRVAAADPPTWRASPQAGDWAGRAVAEVLGLDLSDDAIKARVRSLLKTWQASGLLTIEDAFDDHGVKRPFVVVGKWMQP